MVLENGETYHENAEKKARAFYKVYRLPVLSDDSGLEVDALGGDPGACSARYGGEKISWEQRWNALYSKLASSPPSAWTARFLCVLCYYDGGKAVRFFEGKTAGVISPRPRGERGFGYDPIFYSPELGKTFGEASFDEKQNVSHRARAVSAFLEWWTGDSIR